MHLEVSAEFVKVISAEVGRVVGLIWKGMCALCCRTSSFRQAGFIKNVSMGAWPEGYFILFFKSNAYGEW